MTQHAGPPDHQVRLSPSAASRCRRRIHLDHDPSVDRAAKSDPDTTFELRMTDLAAHRQQVLATPVGAELMPAGGGVTAGETNRWTPAAADRPLLLRDIPLRTRTRFGVIDFLVHDGTGYLPIIVRGHRTLDNGTGANLSSLQNPLDIRRSGSRKARSQPRDALVLAHFYRMLEELELGSTAGIGGVIGRGVSTGDSQSICWHQLSGSGSTVLAEYDERFADRLAVATAAATGATPLALPSRIAECRRCPWNELCTTEMTRSRDISLVTPGLDAQALRAVGLLTIDDLANADPDLVQKLPLTGVNSGEVIVRARAWLQQVSLVRRRPEVRVTRADIELDVDMESYVEDGAYLWGTLLSGSERGMAAVRAAGFDCGYRGFATWEVMPTADEVAPSRSSGRL